MKFPKLPNGAIVALVFACISLCAEGQQAERGFRLGYLYIGSASDDPSRLDLFRKALRELGYIEGRNLVLETRYADGKPERLTELAAELVRRKVDVIVVTSGVAALVAKQATQSIPIVMTGSGDAVRQGIVASLARPGGNVTGLTLISPDLSRKRLQILQEIVPRLSHVGVLWCGPINPVGKQEWAETQAAAKSLGVQLSSLEAPVRENLASAFALAEKRRVQAILMFDCSSLNPSVVQIVELSRKHRLPGMYPFPRFAEAGGLVSYGASEQDRPARAASYVDKILKGAKPADLPVEQPTKFELVVNLKTAKALGIAIPQSVLSRASEVMQ